MSHKSFSDIIEDTLHIDFSLSFGDPPSASKPYNGNKHAAYLLTNLPSDLQETSEVTSKLTTPTNRLDYKEHQPKILT